MGDITNKGHDILKALGIEINNVPQPRAPPRFIRPPSPFVMERPTPIVPEVSLILDSASTSFHSTFRSDLLDNSSSRNEKKSQVGATNSTSTFADSAKSTSSDRMIFANYYPTPTENQISNLSDQCISKLDVRHDSEKRKSSYGRSSKNTSVSPKIIPGSVSPEFDDEDDDMEVLKSALSSILIVVTQQNQTIAKLTSKMDQVIEFQDNFLSQMFKKGAGVSKSVQTEMNPVQSAFTSTSNLPNLRNSNDSSQENFSGQQKRSGNSTVTVSSSSTKPNRTENSSTINKRSLKSPTLQTNDKVATSIPRSSKEDKNTDDLSALLKNLEFSNVHEPSVFSETSMMVDMNDFQNDTFQQNGDTGSMHIGTYNSSDDDYQTLEPVVKPTKTLYNNMLGAVNRLLDGGAQTEVNPRSSSNQRISPDWLKNVKKPDSRSSKSSVAPVHSKNSVMSYSSSSNSSDGIGNDSPSEKSRSRSRDYEQRIFSTQDKIPPNSRNQIEAENTTNATKKYLQTLGVQFENSANANVYKENVPPFAGVSSQPQNCMIQQNVYNSIYIPTVNCVPVVSDSMNSNSGLIQNLAHKYIPRSELNQYDVMNANKKPGGTETTLYGMSSNNLSFATKQYLQRYGLVGGQNPIQSGPEPALAPRPQHENFFQMPMNNYYKTDDDDRILDITAIRNQPKLL